MIKKIKKEKIFTPDIIVISFAENPISGGSPPNDIINIDIDIFSSLFILDE